MDRLAVCGGKPVRTRPFAPSVVMDEKETRYVKEVLKAKELSRFMGSPSKDIDELLTLPSRDALRYKAQYFNFLGGRMIRLFEAGFAKRFEVPYAISVNSATSGLAMALGAIGAGPGDEVITTCLSFNATAMGILAFNSVPVFVDVDRQNFCMDPQKVEKAITPKTKAILVVHLMGNAADMGKIMKIAGRNRIRVVEDCAQAAGTRYREKFVGTIGDMGIFSFQETKNITTGEGGMAVTKDAELARRARLIRNHGESIPDDLWDDDNLINLIGMNFRMTELTAAVGVAQLEKLSENNRVRTENAAYLAKELAGLRGTSIPALRRGAVPHVFALLYDGKKTGVGRGKVLAALRAEGILVGSGYLRTMYENPVFLRRIAYGNRNCPWSCHLYGADRVYHKGDCPVAEKLLKEEFVWFYHINRPNTIDDMKDVVRAFRKVFSNLNMLRKVDIDTRIGYKW